MLLKVPESPAAVEPEILPPAAAAGPETRPQA
jgi:hypothetical protein